MACGICAQKYSAAKSAKKVAAGNSAASSNKLQPQAKRYVITANPKPKAAILTKG